jgi:hypothetical protein
MLWDAYNRCYIIGLANTKENDEQEITEIKCIKPTNMEITGEGMNGWDNIDHTHITLTFEENALFSVMHKNIFIVIVSKEGKLIYRRWCDEDSRLGYNRVAVSPLHALYELDFAFDLEVR